MRTSKKCESQNLSPVNRRSGMACVEFAVLLPFLMIILVGIVEVGNALRASHSLQGALREGGRLAVASSTNDNLNSKVVRDVRAFVYAAGFSGRNVEVTIQDAGTGASVSLGDTSLQGTLVRIAAGLPYDTIEIFPRQFLSGDTISASIVIRIPEH